MNWVDIFFWRLHLYHPKLPLSPIPPSHPPRLRQKTKQKTSNNNNNKNIQRVDLDDTKYMRYIFSMSEEALIGYYYCIINSCEFYRHARCHNR